MKYLLASSLLVCLVCLWPLKRYRITCLYLLACLPATLTFRAESQWLRAWYPWLALPVVLLRLAAGVEVLHRQTEGFYYWARLTGLAFLNGVFFAAMGAVQFRHADALAQTVDVRRLLQIFLGGVYVYVIAFWSTQGGAWYRQRDHLSALFGVMVLNHAAISFLGGALGWDAGAWNRVQPWSWGIDTGVYLLMAVRCRLSIDARLVHRIAGLIPFARFGSPVARPAISSRRN